MDLLKILLLSLSFYANAFAQEEEVYSHRLQQKIEIDSYNIELTLKDGFHETAEFYGTVDIRLTTNENLDEIILHSVDIEYTGDIKITATDDEGNAINTLTLTHEYLPVAYQQLRLKPETAETSISAGTYLLVFEEFKGKLHDDMYGFYLSSYEVAEGEIEYLATTQFQATYARRAFPCFDEPNYKAKFTVTINRPLGYTTLGNTEVTVVETETSGKDTFGPTPKMSTYLLAFIISKFKNYGEIAETKTPGYDVWCREESLSTAEFSYGISPEIMAKFNEITGRPYLEADSITKMDQIAIPDFAAGAMENWGLVTYRETSLLWDKNHSTVSNRQRIGMVIAHEFAHMWFGNLVTLDWWDYTWLNEGFARYYQYIVAGEVLPDWELDQQFVTDVVQAILVTDSVEGNSLNSESSSASEVSNKFATLSYSKGAAVIRMMINFLGEDNYLSGIRNYLSENEYGNTEPSHLYSALDEFAPKDTLPTTLDVIMESWTELDGYPVITVSRNSSGLVLTQERFLLNSGTSSHAWYVPITYTTAANPNFENTEDIKWLKPDVNELLIDNENEEEEEGWVLVNIKETGYYRVNYADELWDELEAALKGNVNFPSVQKAQIVDDALNLARASKLSYSKAFNITSYLESETSYYPWTAAFNAFSFLRKRIDSESETGKYLQQHILTLMQALYESVDFNPDNSEHVNTLRTALALQWACQLGNEDCVEKALEYFDSYASGTDLNADIRSTVYCTAVREDDTGENWDKLREKFDETNLATEKNTILTALGCSRDAEILKGYLELSISDTIRKQDASTVFSAVLAGNPENVDTAFTFLKDNINEIINHYGGMNSLTSVVNGIADRLTTKAQVDEFEAFLNEAADTLKDAEHQMTSAIATARANLAWAESNQEELFEWLDSTYGSAASITLNLTLFVAAIVTVFLNL